MDLIRFKLAINRECKIKRLNYNPLGDLTNPKVTGLLPSESIFDLGTPNLHRHENTTIIASDSTTKSSIVLRLKWRPHRDTNLVTCISQLTFTIDGESYRYDQTETYVPAESTARPGRILQYGSNGSRLKVFISRPYMRTRVVFRGHADASNGSASFLKLNLVLNYTGNVFDFKHQINENCFKQIYDANKPRRPIDAALTELALVDRHEGLVRISGEFLLNNDSTTRQELTSWGFFIRQFVETKAPAMRTKRIIAHMSNGQAFHIGNNTIDDDHIGYGFTCFEITPYTVAIDKPTVIDWSKVDGKTQELEFEVSGQDRTFKCKAKRRAEPSSFFDIEMNGKQGWMLIELDDNIDTKEEAQSIEQSLIEYQDDLKNGRIVQQVLNVSMQDKPLIVNLDDDACSLSELVGSKASSLAQLTKYAKVASINYCVPGGLVLTRFAYDSIIDHNSSLEAEIKKLEDLVGSGDLANLREACEALQKSVEGSQLPESLRQQLSSSLSERYGDRLDSIAFAVRSSSWGEDEDDMSAAGQLSTLLNVRGIDAVLAAVSSCFASKFTHANVEYKRQHGLPLTLPMAVVIQEMVESDKAGVMFTCNPTTGDDSELVITANYGLGESVVSGQSEPDTVVLKMVDETLTIKTTTVGAKSIIISNNSNEHDKSKCCLSDEEILKLGKCGLVIAKYYRCQRDIEWGYKGGELYMFQSRPVTGLDGYTELELIHECDLSSRAEFEYVSRANVGEVLPFAITPMTLTYCMLSWTFLAYRIYSKFVKDLGDFHPGCISDLIYESYHLFFTLRCSRLFPSVEGERPLMTRAMEVSMFGHEIGEQPELVEASAGLKQPEDPFQGLRYNLYCTDLRLMPFRTVTKEKQTMRTLGAKMKSLELATGYNENKMLGLYNQMSKIKSFGEIGWFNHILVIWLSNECNAALTGFLSKYIKDPVRLFTAVAKILGNSPNVLSAEIPERIERIARLIENKDKFVQMSLPEALEYLEDENNPNLRKEISEFFEKFGHRSYNEFELASTPWRENKGAIVDMIQKNCSQNRDSLGEKKKLSIEEVVKSLDLELSMKDEFILKKMIAPKCQVRVAVRELTKDILIECNDKERIACRALASELRRNLRIPDEDLFFYFFYDELEPLIRAPQPALVAQAIRRRNMFKIFKEPWKFDEIFCTRNLKPNHMKPQKELDAKVVNAPKLYGTPASSGRTQAKVCFIDGYKNIDKMRAGDILLTHSTDIAFSPIFPLCSGIITEVGGLISHGAVVAREYGLPSVLGIPNVTRILEDGEEIILDADKGAIIRLDKSPLK